MRLRSYDDLLAPPSAPPDGVAAPRTGRPSKVFQGLFFVILEICNRCVLWRVSPVEGGSTQSCQSSPDPDLLQGPGRQHLLHACRWALEPVTFAGNPGRRPADRCRPFQ